MLHELKSLRNQAVERLERRSVFDIDAYGWLNADDVDPDLVGYAMWTLTPPYDHDFEAWQNNTPPGRSPTDREQRLMELGHDFFGLMKTARHFIGFALLVQPTVETYRVEPDDFDFNEFAALVALTSAFDRLRDFMIIAILHAKTEDKTQFAQAVELLRTAGLTDEANRLTTKHTAIRRVRQARNTAAHGLGTEPARAQRRLIDMDRDAVKRQGWQTSGDSTYEGVMGAAAKAEEEARAAVESRVQLLCDCYTGLVKWGDACFRAEYAWRRRPAI
jgi:hypothetical protein